MNPLRPSEDADAVCAVFRGDARPISHAAPRRRGRGGELTVDGAVRSPPPSALSSPLSQMQ
jgi:hypothetical protein